MDLAEAKKRFKAHLLSIDKGSVFDLISQFMTVDGGHSLVDELIMPTLQDIGDMWVRGEASLSQVYMAGKICEEVVDRHIPKENAIITSDKKVAVAVLQDHHNLGKKILATGLRTGGYQVTDYGHAVTVEDLISNVEKDSIDYLMISCLMLPAALHIKEAVEGIRSRSPHTRVLVGGAPFVFDSTLWKEVGADGYGRTAMESIALLNRMIKEVE